MPKYRRLAPALTVTLVTAITLASAPPAAAAKSSTKRCGKVTTRSGPVIFKATGITAAGGVTCRRARHVVKALARKRGRDFDGCAVPIANRGTCDVLGYACVQRSPGRRRALRVECQHHDAVNRIIRWNETQDSRG